MYSRGIPVLKRAKRQPLVDGRPKVVGLSKGQTEPEAHSTKQPI